MSQTLESARALLEAKSFVAARRAVGELLEERPEDPNLLRFAVEIEMKAGDYKLARELIRSALAHAPDNVFLREDEVPVLAYLGKKKEARDALERFKRDFPTHTGRIERLSMLVDSVYERSHKIKKKLSSLNDFGDPLIQRGLGIAHHNINDFYTAQHLLEAAHKHLPDDEVLNETLATNSSQLGWPSKARTYAQLALKKMPDNRRLRFLYWVSYLLYFPPFFMTAKLFLLIGAFSTMVGKWPGMALGVGIMIYYADFYYIWFDALSILTRWPISTLGPMLAFIGVYTLSVLPQTFNKWMPARKSVRLKKY